MKLETLLRCPELSATIESNEAHIRMLFGTWRACRLGFWLTIPGMLVSVYGCFKLWDAPIPLMAGRPLLFPYMIWTLITLVLLFGTFFGKRRIEELFHYRRVRELLDVVVAYHLASNLGKPIEGKEPHP